MLAWLGRVLQASQCRRTVLTWLREVEAVTSGGGGGGGRGCGGSASWWACSFGCGRPCAHAGRVPAVLAVRLYGASDPVHRQSASTSSMRRWRVPTVQTVEKTVEVPQVLFLGYTCPLLCNDRFMVEAVQKTLQFPQLQRWSMSLLRFLGVSRSRTTGCCTDNILVVTVQKTVEVPQLLLSLGQGG